MEGAIPAIARAYEACVPLFVTMELTLACNLRCVHCYNFDRAQPMPKEAVGRELNPSEIKRVLGELAEAGALEVSFSGGEALVHPHLDEFIAHARALRFAVRIKSNGMLITPQRASALAALGVYAVDVSLYGASADTHDAFTTVKGSFERTVAGVRAARDAGLKVSLSFCLTRHNATEIAEMVALADEIGASHVIDPQLTARYDGTTSSLDHRVDMETLEALYRGPLRSALGEIACHPDKDVSCSCARTVCGISSTGEVYPCIGAPVPSGNLRDATFAEIWTGSPALNRIRGLAIEDFGACHTCADRPFCRRSSGVVYTNTGDYTGPEDWTCGEAAVLRRLYEDGAEVPAGPTGGLRHC